MIAKVIFLKCDHIRQIIRSVETNPITKSLIPQKQGWREKYCCAQPSCRCTCNTFSAGSLKAVRKGEATRGAGADIKIRALKWWMKVHLIKWKLNCGGNKKKKSVLNYKLLKANMRKD